MTTSQSHSSTLENIVSILFGLIELIDHLGFLIYLRSYSSLCPKGLETAVRETDYSNKISQNKTIALAYLLVNIAEYSLPV